MTLVTCRMCISVDGYTAAPNQSLENPFGEGGMRLNDWMFETDQPGREGDAAILTEAGDGIGAFVMGRKMFGGGDGEWNASWIGWWGDEPPFHVPVFVLTHHPREPLEMKGGTTFTFVTDGIESAMEQARTAAGSKKVAVAGGASAVRQYLAAGLIDELYLHIVPITLGAGERPFDRVDDLTMEPLQVVGSPTVTHIRYRVAH
jgi:dihydrofolate reductase